MVCSSVSFSVKVSVSCCDVVSSVSTVFSVAPVLISSVSTVSVLTVSVLTVVSSACDVSSSASLLVSVICSSECPSLSAVSERTVSEGVSVWFSPSNVMPSFVLSCVTYSSAA